jgi:hypothetical protein
VTTSVKFERVQLRMGGKEVVSVGLVGVLDAEVVDDETDGDVAGCVAQNAVRY